MELLAGAGIYNKGDRVLYGNQPFYIIDHGCLLPPVGERLKDDDSNLEEWYPIGYGSEDASSAGLVSVDDLKPFPTGKIKTFYEGEEITAEIGETIVVESIEDGKKIENALVMTPIGPVSLRNLEFAGPQKDFEARFPYHHESWTPQNWSNPLVDEKRLAHLPNYIVQKTLDSLGIDADPEEVFAIKEGVLSDMLRFLGLWSEYEQEVFLQMRQVQRLEKDDGNGGVSIYYKPFKKND